MRRRKKPYFTILTAILLSMSLTACSGGKTNQQTAAASAETVAEETEKQETEEPESTENAAPGNDSSENSGIAASGEELPFPLGQKIESDSFTGNAYIEMMIANDDTYHFPQTNHLTFEPGARSSWHNHGGMVLLATGGVGYYQEEGKPAQILRPGDVVNIEPGVRHWHGATPDSWFSQIVIFDSHYVPEGGEAPAEEPVTDEQYNALETEEYAGRTVTPDNEFMFARAPGAVEFETFSGPSYVSSLLEANNAAGAPELHYVVFDPGVINNWHTHEGGQILIATDGIGYHQMEGEEVQVLYPGDVALCPPGVKHWHGGSADTSFAHIAVNTNPELTGLEWFDRISDEEYDKLPKEKPEENADGVVQTTAGLVQGSNEDGIYRYLGIPYAEAKERFVPAEEVTPWEGVRAADSYGPISPQGVISGVGGAADQDGTDNNSQNLNIWTPGINDGKKRPVMVWLHGGGFSTGSANEDGYDGESLSRSGDAVVVSVNHRLNVFGYLDLSAYGEKYKDSANVGIRDIIDSLEWIQDNIEAFGGDPDNVTVFGQSGGGAKVLALMTSPYAKGLFHKGIVQSGATETMGVIFNTQEASTRLAENILKKLNITEDNLEEIQTVLAEELEAAAGEALGETGEELKLPAALGGGYSMDWEPVVDGDFLPTNPVTEKSFAEAGKDIPLLIGSNLNEWSGFFEADPVEPTEELTAALKKAYPDKEELTAEQVDTTTIRLPLLKIMSHKADQNGAPVYAYMFTYGNSYHGAEIPYVFNLADGNKEEEALAETVSQAWINFARTGTPGGENLPEWEPYTRESGATMILDLKPELIHHHDQELLSILVPEYEY